MAPWGWVSGGYGVFLALTALGRRGAAPPSRKRSGSNASARQGLPSRKRNNPSASAWATPKVIVACVAYALVGLGLGTIEMFWVHLVAPSALLLGGYWLSGFFFHEPQPWLERWLLTSDRRVFEALGIDRALTRAPDWVLEVLEAAYTADYVVVAAGALLSASAGFNALTRYWTLVVAAELACYVMLPFLRSRPPRALEPPGVIERRAPRLRRFNLAILDRASVQANTFPSGHVAGAVAAALAVMSVSAMAGWVLMLAALLVAVSAAAGRYHYTVDCVLGAAVAVAASVVTSVVTSVGTSVAP